MSGDLVAFLRARLDEDEQTARTACEYAEASWKLDEEFGETILWWPPEPRIAEKERKHGLPVTSDQWRGQTIESGGTRIATHIARHDPARVLREVEAQRRILAQYSSALVTSRHAEGQVKDLVEGAVNTYRHVLAALALAYADHPVYREEWRP